MTLQFGVFINPLRGAQVIQQALHSISEWCDAWGLKISADKSISVVFTRSNITMPRLRNPLVVNGEKLPELSFHTFLGITLDSASRSEYTQAALG